MANLRSENFIGYPRLHEVIDNNNPLRLHEPDHPAVRAVQQALISFGFSMPRSTNFGSTAPDGIYGLETRETVAKFQASNGLVPDGIVGPLTMTALDNSLVPFFAVIAI